MKVEDASRTSGGKQGSQAMNCSSEVAGFDVQFVPVGEYADLQGG